MKISVYAAIGIESRTSPGKYSRINVSSKFGERGIFLQLFESFYLENQLRNKTTKKILSM